MNGSPMSTGDVFEAAADLIEPEGAWTQGRYAATANGNGAPYDSSIAICWCAEGAILRVARASHHTPVSSLYDFVRRATGQDSLARWNDDPNRQQSEVVSALRKAAALARTEEPGQ